MMPGMYRNPVHQIAAPAPPAWAVIQPLFTMVVFSIFFGKLGKMPSDGIPYPVFSFAALVPWTLFSNGLTQASASVVASSNLIKKVYFPRLIIPTATVLAGVVDFLIAFGVLLALAVMRLVASFLYGVAPNDPVTLTLAACALAAVALGAALIPAWRGARLNPLVALRDE